METLGLVHLVAALAALVSGTAVLPRRKGDVGHRYLGRVYFGSMVVLNLTALLIYRLTGAFGPFHVAAVVSLATVAAGVAAARSRRPGWLLRHYYWMGFSYVGLIAAAVSEVLTRVPEAPFWGTVAFSSLVCFGVGAYVVHRRVRTSLEPFRGAGGGASRRREARPADGQSSSTSSMTLRSSPSGSSSIRLSVSKIIVARRSAS